MWPNALFLWLDFSSFHLQPATKRNGCYLLDLRLCLKLLWIDNRKRIGKSAENCAEPIVIMLFWFRFLLMSCIESFHPFSISSIYLKCHRVYCYILCEWGTVCGFSFPRFFPFQLVLLVLFLIDEKLIQIHSIQGSNFHSHSFHFENSNSPFDDITNVSNNLFIFISHFSFDSCLLSDSLLWLLICIDKEKPMRFKFAIKSSRNNNISIFYWIR